MKKLTALLILLTLSLHVFAINPIRQYQITPDQLGLKYETKRIYVTSAIEVNSWLFMQNENDKPFIIVSNSDSGNMSNCLGQAREFF